MTALVLSSCAPAHRVVDAPFVPYVERFDALAATTLTEPLKTLPLRIYFGAVKTESTIGECWHDDEVRDIVVNEALWGELEELEREEFIFHELGHCLLGRPHILTRIVMAGQNIPESIMHPHVFDGALYGAYREYYIRELFLHIPKSAHAD